MNARRPLYGLRASAVVMTVAEPGFDHSGGLVGLQGSLELRHQLLDGLVAVGRKLGGRPLDHGIDRGRHVAASLPNVGIGSCSWCWSSSA